MSDLFDLGLQPERTLLAWRRTILAIGVGGLVGLRLLPVVFSAAGIAPPLAIIAIALLLHVYSERRFRSSYVALSAQHPLPSAAPLALALAALVALTALVAIVGVIVLAASRG